MHVLDWALSVDVVLQMDDEFFHPASHLQRAVQRRVGREPVSVRVLVVAQTVDRIGILLSNTDRCIVN